MAYCGPIGLPRSVFLAWDVRDQDAALQWQAWDAARCSGCGTRDEEWRRDDGTTDPLAFLPTPHQCQGCAAIERTQESREKHRVNGERVHLIRRDHFTQ